MQQKARSFQFCGDPAWFCHLGDRLRGEGGRQKPAASSTDDGHPICPRSHTGTEVDTKTTADIVSPEAAYPWDNV